MKVKVIISIAILIILAALLTWILLGHKTTGGQVKHNPASLRPVVTVFKQQGQGPQTLAVYHNQDKRGDYYAVGFPREWKVSMGNASEYKIKFGDVEGSVTLAELSGKDSLETFVLNQAEPELKNALREYQRIDLSKSTKDKTEIWLLQYQYMVPEGLMEGLTAYVKGDSKAGIITFNCLPENYSQQVNAFRTVISSFQWDKK